MIKIGRYYYHSIFSFPWDWFSTTILKKPCIQSNIKEIKSIEPSLEFDEKELQKIHNKVFQSLSIPKWLFKNENKT